MSFDPYGAPSNPSVPPAPGVPVQQRGTSGLVIAGLILAILIAPIGFILSLIGFIHAVAQHRKGKVLAIIGLVISVLIMGCGGFFIYKAVDRVSTLTDPGCSASEQAILDNAKADPTDKASFTASLQKTIDKLTAAADEANHDNVRDAILALRDDYKALLQKINGGSTASDIQEKSINDAANIVSLCTIGSD